MSVESKKNIRFKHFRESLTLLKGLFAKKQDDDDLYEIIVKAIDDKLNDLQQQYFERLLSDLISESGAPEVLIILNFNARKYFQYYVKRIATQLEAEDTARGKLEKLRLELKIVNQVQCEFNIAYSNKFPSIQTMIADWISEEIRFLEKSNELSIVNPSNEKEFIKGDFKFEFDMSVSQFAFFIKAFIETGVIQNKNISELIRFLSRFVKTKRSENISYESFRMKYYNVEDSTKNAVKNTFHTVIGFINSN